eukprot:6756892-Pyramimonas_sp.AAC.1
MLWAQKAVKEHRGRARDFARAGKGYAGPTPMSLLECEKRKQIENEMNDLISVDPSSEQSPFHKAL